MVQRNDILSLGFYEKSPFTGSDHLLRYRIEKLETVEKKLLQITIWQGIYSFDHTPIEEKTTHTEDFSEEGMQQIITWLNQKSSELSSRKS